MNIYNGKLNHIESIYTKDIIVESLSSSSSSLESYSEDIHKQLNLVYTDINGKLLNPVQGNINNTIYMNKVNINELVIGSSVNGGGRLFSNITFDANTVDYGIPAHFTTTHLTINSMATIGGSGSGGRGGGSGGGGGGGSDSRGRVVMSLSNGTLVPTSSELLAVSDDGQTLYTSNLTSKGHISASTLSIHSLKSPTSSTPTTTTPTTTPTTTHTTGVLTATNDGHITTSTSIQLHNLNISTNLTLDKGAKLHINDHPDRNSLITIDTEGHITPPNANKDYYIPSLTSDHLTSQALHITQSAEINTLVLTNLSSNTATSKLLTTDTHGNVGTSSTISLQAVHTGDLNVTGVAYIDSLYINNFHPTEPQHAESISGSDSNKQTQVNDILTISTTGKLVKSSYLSLQHITTQECEIKGKLRVNSLIDASLTLASSGATVPSASTPTLSAATVDSVKAIYDVNGLVPVGATPEGRLALNPELTVAKLTNLGDLVNHGTIETSALKLTTPNTTSVNPTYTSLLALSAHGSGLITPITSARLDSIQAQSLQVKQTLQAQSIQLTPTTTSSTSHPTSTAVDMIVIDTNGTLHPTSSSQYITNIIATLPPPDSVTYDKVEVRSVLTASAVKLPSLGHYDPQSSTGTVGMSGYLVSDNDGNVQIIDKNKVTFDTLNIQNLNVQHSIHASSLTLSDTKPTDRSITLKDSHHILTIDSKGQISDLSPDLIHLTSDEIVIKNLAIETLSSFSTSSGSGSGGGSIQAKGVVIDGIELINTKIKSSNTFLSAGSAAGDLAVRRAVSVYTIITSLIHHIPLIEWCILYMLYAIPIQVFNLFVSYTHHYT